MTAPEFQKAAPAAPSGDYYALLGLPETFALDARDLEQRFRDRSKHVHPDRFVTAPTPERVRALQASMALNDAYVTLKKPATRAEYLLTRRGVAIGDNEVLDPEFLMAVLDKREELSEAKRARDYDKLRELEDYMLGRERDTVAEVGALFAVVEADAADGEAGDVLGQIKAKLILLRYIRRYLDEFDDLDLD